ncbi:hypothetical protein M0811_00037 [Anaeramoeba ignava]|uniref:Transposase n=1 Tax=Anaeramoeba ignava TaxID=1746090 RepID=A0A9Q0LQA7_ANAIG|nr:hypothetical protein M0811_00037 [Anaeramoeba ignava]
METENKKEEKENFHTKSKPDENKKRKKDYEDMEKKGQGHAKWCTEVMVHLGTRKVVDCEIMIAKPQGEKRSREAVCVRNLLNRFIPLLMIDGIVTDGEKSDTVVMREEFPQIKHKLCKSHKENSILSKFDSFFGKLELRRLKNMVREHWKVCTSKSFDAASLLQRWRNLANHVSGDHSQCVEFCETTRCSQSNYQSGINLNEEQNDKFNQFLESVLNEEEAEKYVGAMDTSVVESFNSVILKYASKRESFQRSFPSRIQLATLHWNENVETGKHLFLGKEEAKELYAQECGSDLNKIWIHKNLTTWEKTKNFFTQHKEKNQTCRSYQETIGDPFLRFGTGISTLLNTLAKKISIKFWLLSGYVKFLVSFNLFAQNFNLFKIIRFPLSIISNIISKMFYKLF